MTYKFKINFYFFYFFNTSYSIISFINYFIKHNSVLWSYHLNLRCIIIIIQNYFLTKNVYNYFFVKMINKSIFLKSICYFYTNTYNCVHYILHFSVFGLRTVLIKQSAVHIYLKLMFYVKYVCFQYFLEVWSWWCSTDGYGESVTGVSDGYCPCSSVGWM